ncbi:MAG: (2Fe-2S)-binding protein [Chloroflexi bacterium]|nr:(2Fe-2S)-binding protein [Chloroflexota bacterium]
MKKVIELIVNGESHDVAIKSNQTLLEVLRDTLGYTATKEGCGLGACSSCTVIIDGEAALACLTLAESAAGKEIVTVEGLGKDGQLHSIQASFVEHGAIQCGFCTPGMIMAAKALLDKNPQPSREEIKLAIAGNMCRCTGYQKIVEAIEAVGSAVRSRDTI